MKINKFYNQFYFIQVLNNKSSHMHSLTAQYNQSSSTSYLQKYSSPHYAQDREENRGYSFERNVHRDRENISSHSKSYYEYTSPGQNRANYYANDEIRNTNYRQINRMEYLKTPNNKKFNKPDYKYLRHQRMNTEPGHSYSEYKNNRETNINIFHDKETLNRQIQEDLKIKNQQKINNIERINDKIKKILETLNEEERKLTDSQKYKIKKKSYMGRIKTEGDEYESETIKNYLTFKDLNTTNHQQHIPYKKPEYTNKYENSWEKYEPKRTAPKNDENVYNKLKGIRTKYDYNVDRSSLNTRSALGQINNQNKSNHEKSEMIDGRKISFDNIVDSSSFILNQQHKFQSNKKVYGCFDNEETKIQSFQDHLNIKEEKYNENNKTINKQDPSFRFFTPEKYQLYRQSTSIETKQKEEKQKNYDEQINRIQDKIEQFENIKRSIGIQPSPNKVNIREMIRLSHSRQKSNRSRQFNHSRIISSKIKEKDEKSEMSSDPSKATGRFPSEFSYQNIKNSDNLKKQQENEHEIWIPKPFKISKKGTKRQLGESNCIESEYIWQGEKSEMKDSQFLIKNSREQRNTKKKHSTIHDFQNPIDNEEQIIKKQFLKKLCEQIQLDSQLRDLKKWFTKRSSPYKWLQLKKSLSVQQINNLMSEQQLKQAFILGQEQDNPFYTQREEDGASNQNLLKAYQEAQGYWNREIKNKYSPRLIKSMAKDIDIDKKGYIIIEDLVRYINIESDLYYRNRDVYLIFKRIWNRENQKHNQRISEESLLDQLSQRY